MGKLPVIRAKPCCPIGSGIPSMLPPCRVCGSEAVGTHYSVVCCQRCRSFFGRMLSVSCVPPCKQDQSCTVPLANRRRQICTACRYTACLKRGMKKVKKCGRYTHAIRTDYIHEVQGLQVKDLPSAPSQDASQLTDSSSIDSCDSRVEEASIPNHRTRDQELDDIIEQLTEAHLRTAPNDIHFYATIKERESKYKETSDLKIKMFGPMKPMPLNDYLRIYKATGVDIDGRYALLETMVPGIERFVLRLIRFIKQMPGFSNLNVDDKISLLKGSIFESDLISSYPIYNNELPCFIDPDNQEVTISYHEFGMFYDYNKVHLFAHCADVLQRLDLLPEEQAVLYAYMVLTADCELSSEGRLILDPIKDTIEECMIRVYSKHHDHPNKFLANLVSVILKLKNAQREWYTAYGDVIKDYSDINWPPIVQNVLVR